MLLERTARDSSTVKEILATVKREGRAALSAPEAKRVADAYGIPVPREGLAESADAAVALAAEMGLFVVLKIVSPDILHKTDAGGVVGVGVDITVRAGFARIVENARAYFSGARISGVQAQQMLPAGAQEVIAGAVTDPTFGKLVAFGLGGVLVEVLKDVTFRLAPATRGDALSMLDGIAAAEMLRGVRGSEAVNHAALAAVIENVSALIADFAEIGEIDVNPVFATARGAIAVDIRIVLDADPFKPRPQRSRQEILSENEPDHATRWYRHDRRLDGGR